MEGLRAQQVCVFAEGRAKSAGKGGKSSPEEGSEAASESGDNGSEDGSGADASAEEVEAPRKTAAKQATGKKKRKRSADVDVAVRRPHTAAVQPWHCHYCFLFCGWSVCCEWHTLRWSCGVLEGLAYESY